MLTFKVLKWEILIIKEIQYSLILIILLPKNYMFLNRLHAQQETTISSSKNHFYLKQDCDALYIAILSYFKYN